MEIYLVLVIIVLILISFVGFMGWREYALAKKLESQSLRLSSAKRAFLKLNENITNLEKQHLELLKKLNAQAEKAEASQAFAERAALDLQFLRSEFETILAYRKQAANFDHVEGL